jgi:hypothetical protein
MTNKNHAQIAGDQVLGAQKRKCFHGESPRTSRIYSGKGPGFISSVVMENFHRFTPHRKEMKVY